MLDIIASAALSIINLYSRKISRFIESRHFKVLGFSAGTLIALIFLFLLPDAAKGTAYINTYILVLLGFAIFHIAEKYLYQHVHNKEKLMEDLAELHIIGFFIDHFMVGFFLAVTFSLEHSLKFAILIPLLLHIISSSMSLEHIHLRIKSFAAKFMLSFSVLFGALAARLITSHPLVYYTLFSLSIGSMLYIVCRDILPKERDGEPIYFIAGVAIILLLDLLSKI